MIHETEPHLFKYYSGQSQMLSLCWMVINMHLLVGPMFSNHVVKKLLVDVVVEVFDSHLNLGRLSHIILVDLKTVEMDVSIFLGCKQLYVSKEAAKRTFSLGTGRSIGSSLFHKALGILFLGSQGTGGIWCGSPGTVEPS